MILRFRCGPNSVNREIIKNCYNPEYCADRDAGLGVMLGNLINQFNHIKRCIKGHKLAAGSTGLIIINSYISRSPRARGRNCFDIFFPNFSAPYHLPGANQLRAAVTPNLNPTIPSIDIADLLAVYTFFWAVSYIVRDKFQVFGSHLDLRSLRGRLKPFQ